MVGPDEQRPSLLPAAERGMENLLSSVDDVKAKDVRIRQAIELIQTGRSVRVGNIAASLNLSPSGFRHLFKKELGIPPCQYVKLVRLERAKKLLESSFLRVKEVAAFVGVNDVSHFVRDYKALYGKTPSQTRRRQRSKAA